MNCQNCKHWVFNKCAITGNYITADKLCNGWELSVSFDQAQKSNSTPEDITELKDTIAELERRITEAKEILENEMGEWLPLQVPYLPEGMMPIRKALDVLEGEEEEVTKGQGLPKNFPPVMGSGDGLGWY